MSVVVAVVWDDDADAPPSAAAQPAQKVRSLLVDGVCRWWWQWFGMMMLMVWFSTTLWGTSSKSMLLADGWGMSMVVAVVWDDGVGHHRLRQ